MRWLSTLSISLVLSAASQACDAVDLASAVRTIDMLSPVEEANWRIKILAEGMRCQLEGLVVTGDLTVAEFDGLLPAASAAWHEPRHQPTRSRPQVLPEPQLSSGYSFWLPAPMLSWSSGEVAADLPECELDQLCKANIFLAHCWRTLPDSLPPAPPPQCFVCRRHQVSALRLPILIQGRAILHTLALPELRLKWPRLTAGIFHQEAKNDNFFVGGLHSRTLAQMDAIIAFMKQNLNAQLLEVRFGVQQLFTEQRQTAEDALMGAVRDVTEAATDLVNRRPGTNVQQRTRMAANAVAAIVNTADRSRRQLTAQFAEQHAWAQERLLSSFCTDSDYRFGTC